MIRDCYFRKKALLCGENFYSNKGITLDPKNIEEYEKIICSTKNKIKLSKSKILLAKKLFYILAFKVIFKRRYDQKK